jgi:molybdopterin molybdotransferase
MRLTGLDEALAPVLAALYPVQPVAMRPESAIGLPLATPLMAPSALPAHAIALRSGLAVSALDLVGASPHAPVPLPAAPARVEAGEALPPGCDAVIDPGAVTISGPLIEAMETVEPGTHVRLAGHDLGAGEAIAEAGDILTAEKALVARLAGLDLVMVRRPAVGLLWPEGPERDWLAARLGTIGLAPDDRKPDLVLTPGLERQAGLALRPGETAWLMRGDGSTRLHLPPRSEGMIGGWCALALPVIARLMGLDIATEALTLSRKIVSSVGVAEVALVWIEGNVAHPLAVGDLSLGAIATADAFALLPAGSEGAAAGAVIDFVRFAMPLRSGTAAT